MATYKPWLEIKNVDAWIGNYQVFKNLNIKLNLGENTTILGPNGAGKTALIKLITREIYPVIKKDSVFRIFGSTIINLWELRNQLGIVSGDIERRISHKITASDFVLSGFFGSIGIGRNYCPSQQQKEYAEEILVQLNLDNISTKEYGSLSDGQKKRLIIARSLIHKPRILVLDEPTNALDLKSKHELLALLRSLCKNGTNILLITHKIETIFEEMDRVIFIKHGKIVEDNQRERILDSSKISKLFETPIELIKKNDYYFASQAK